MIAKLKDIAFSRDGSTVISFETREKCETLFDELKGADVDVEIKKHRKKRSLDANAYMWVLCEKIAEKLAGKTTKDEIYRNAIRDVGIFKDFLNLAESDAKTLSAAWGKLGSGWIAEQVDFSADGERMTVRCYYGSSSYNTKQMSRLLDYIIEDAKALGIETETPEEINKIKSLWATERTKK